MDGKVTLRFLLDESVSKASAVRLRMLGHNVVRIGSEVKIPADEDILAFAFKEERILVTHDQDFGMLVFERKRQVGEGVVLFRYESSDAEEVGKRLGRIVRSGVFVFQGRFTTVDEHKVRQREVPA